MKTWMFLVAVAMTVCGCAMLGGSNKEPLRVGITPDFPPLIFMRDGEVAGIEADLMRRLGRELGRPVTVVSMPWNEQVDALLAGRIDIIMSGMSVTTARQVRIDFSTPWMASGVGVLMRKADQQRFTSVESVLAHNGTVGVLADTTAHFFARRNMPRARIIRIASPADAAIQLRRRTVDLFLDDVPSIAWQASSNEGELAVLMDILEREEIAWGIRRGNSALRDEVNAVLARWKADGTTDRVIDAWIPYYSRIR
jgi:ABC-type amino acid transport substrate-binding protein